MQAKQKVLYAEKYKYTSKTTGEVISGTKVTICENQIDDENHKGMPTCDYILPYDSFQKLQKVPGDYNVTYTTRKLKSGNILAVQDLQFVGG